MAYKGPESYVKDCVKAVIKLASAQGVPIRYHMVVQNGMGCPDLDFAICCKGHYIGVETKAPGKEPTPRQLATMASIEAAGGTVLVVNSRESLMEFAALVCKRFNPEQVGDLWNQVERYVIRHAEKGCTAHRGKAFGSIKLAPEGKTS